MLNGWHAGTLLGILRVAYVPWLAQVGVLHLQICTSGKCRDARGKRVWAVRCWKVEGGRVRRFLFCIVGVLRVHANDTPTVLRTPTVPRTSTQKSPSQTCFLLPHNSQPLCCTECNTPPFPLSLNVDVHQEELPPTPPMVQQLRGKHKNHAVEASWCARYLIPGARWSRCRSGEAARQQ